MTKTIHNHVQQICDEHDIIPLIVSENGSRAWGYDSSESDYDVKVVFAHRKHKYLSLKEPTDCYTRQMDDLHDYTFWDIKKFLKLTQKGNAQVFEVVESPIIYYQDPRFDTIHDFVTYTCRKNLREIAYHYYGLAHKTYKERIAESGEPTAKKYLYVIRPLLHVMYMLGNDSLPPLDFQSNVNFAQLPKDVEDEIDSILEKKRQGLLTTEYKARSQILDRYCEFMIESCKSMIDNYHQEPATNLLTSDSKYDIMFRSLLQ